MPSSSPLRSTIRREPLSGIGALGSPGERSLVERLHRLVEQGLRAGAVARPQGLREQPLCIREVAGIDRDVLEARDRMFHVADAVLDVAGIEAQGAARQ